MKILLAAFAIFFISCNNCFEYEMHGVYNVLEYECNNNEIKKPSISLELKYDKSFEFSGDVVCSGKWYGGSYDDFDLIELEINGNSSQGMVGLNKDTAIVVFSDLNVLSERCCCAQNIKSLTFFRIINSH